VTRRAAIEKKMTAARHETEYETGAIRRREVFAMEVRMTADGLTPNGWPFGRFNSLIDELTRHEPREMAPRAEVVENADGYNFYLEMAGLSPESIDVRVEDGALVVEAERQHPEWPDEAKVHLAERAYGKLRRAFELPDDAHRDAIAASYKDGVLHVRVPKEPASKPRKIKIDYQN
jgi:HSP20 family protein